MKTCSRCKNQREDFSLGKKSCDRCVIQRREEGAKYRASLNREEVNAKARAKYAENPVKYKEVRKAWNAANGTRRYHEVLKFDPEYKRKQAEWRAKNPEKMAASRKKAGESFNHRLKRKLACRISAAIKRNGSRKSWRTIDLVGCDIQHLRSHLESKFKDGMNWENHGKYGWHIDHIIPCAAFDMNNIEAQQECFSWRNLQPLWWHENLSKSKKILTEGPDHNLAKCYSI